MCVYAQNPKRRRRRRTFIAGCRQHSIDARLKRDCTRIDTRRSIQHHIICRTSRTSPTCEQQPSTTCGVAQNAKRFVEHDRRLQHTQHSESHKHTQRATHTNVTRRARHATRRKKSSYSLAILPCACCGRCIDDIIPNGVTLTRTRTHTETRTLLALRAKPTTLQGVTPRVQEKVSKEN